MKKTLYIFVSTCSYDLGKISIWDCDMSAYVQDKALLCTQEVEIDIPEFDIVSLQIDGIEKKIAQIRAEAQVQVNDLEQRKQELLAIEWMKMNNNATPNEWVRVPVDLTDAMLRAVMCYDTVQDPEDEKSRTEEVKTDWALLLAAAPQVDQAVEPQVAAIIGYYEGEREPKLLSWNRLPNGEHSLFTAPPTPDVSVLVEALEFISNHGYGDGGHFCVTRADEALAAYKKEQQP